MQNEIRPGQINIGFRKTNFLFMKIFLFLHEFEILSLFRQVSAGCTNKSRFFAINVNFEEYLRSSEVLHSEKPERSKYDHELRGVKV